MKKGNAREHRSCKKHCFVLLVDYLHKNGIAQVPYIFPVPSHILQSSSYKGQEDVVSKKMLTEALPLAQDI